MDLNQTMQTATDLATRVGLQILGAIVLFIVGRWLINLAVRMMTAALNRQKVDPT